MTDSYTFYHYLPIRIMESSFVVGVDIASETITAVALHREGASSPSAPVTVDNSAKGYAELIAWLEVRAIAPSDMHVVMEATGVYWEAFALFIHQNGIPLSVVHPTSISNFAKMRLQRNKTDALDADCIARFGIMTTPALWQPPEIAAQELQMVMRQRDAYMAMLTEERNRRHALRRRPNAPALLLTTSDDLIASIQKSIDTLDVDFKTRLKTTPEWQKTYELLTSIVGIGPITAAVIIAETEGFTDILSSEQFCSYAGLVPVRYRSGTSVKRNERISDMCNHHLRTALYRAAVSTTRSDKAPFKEFYHRLLAAGKQKKQALIAVAHKIARVIFAVLDTQIMFQTGYKRPSTQTAK
jgi:transposase